MSDDLLVVREGAGGWTLLTGIADASPVVTRAALKELASMAGGRRTWAVLGEMRGLGPDTMDEHDSVGRLAVRLDVSRLVCVGPGTRVMHLGASTEGSWGEESAHVPDSAAALAILTAELLPGDIVLVQGSAGDGLDALVDALLLLPAERAEAPS